MCVEDFDRNVDSVILHVHYLIIVSSDCFVTQSPFTLRGDKLARL
jgi:hypothetical protein